MKEVLKGEHLEKKFGELIVFRDLNFSIFEGEIVGLIGPNGAGKTTLFNIICGLYKPESGKIILDGEDITGLPPYVICNLGVARVHQIPRVFTNMTVLENVIVGFLYGKNVSYPDKQKINNILEFVGLAEKANTPASELNLFQRKLLEVARALATNSKVLLLDEPLSGLNPAEIEEARKLIKKIRDEMGITIFWIEHIMRAIKGTTDRVIVIASGAKLCEGPFESVACDTRVIEAYLGEGFAEEVEVG